MTFHDILNRRVLVIDGAMGTMVQAAGFTDEDFGGEHYRMLTDLLTLSHPAELAQIHLDYFRAGAMAVETNTFGASPLRLAEYRFGELDLTRFAGIPEGLDPRSASYDDLAYHLSRRGAEIAAGARDEYAREAGGNPGPLLVIGSMGPSNRVISSTDADLKRSTFDEIAANFRLQVQGLLDGGVDLLLFETQQDVLELKAAIAGAHDAMDDRGRGVPIMAHVTVDQFARMQIFNTDIHAALVAVQGLGIDAFGINCSIGPDMMGKSVEKLSAHSRLPISVMPNAGMPKSEAGRTVFEFPPKAMAEHLARFVSEYGVNVVGGCCGTTPEHIRAIADAVRDLQPKPRTPGAMPYVSGPQQAVALDSSESLICIGERLNVRGSRKVRKAVETDAGIDHSALEAVVHEQVRDLGLSIIDVCMDSNIVDTAETLCRVVHQQTTDFQGAMSLDSFGVEALEQAVKVYPGRPIVNSISMEETEPGVTKAEAVIRATRRHDPVYIALATGPKGPGSTVAEKLDLARQLVEVAGREGVAPERLLIDMNVFPIGSEPEEGLNFAMESLNAIPEIKALHPDLRTVCGVGNLTNGLSKKPYMRMVLTSVWLDEGRKRGLDAAIVNPNHYVFARDLDKRDYELGLRVVAEHDMAAFEELERIAEEKRGGAATKKKVSYEGLSAEEGICQKILDGHKDRQDGEAKFQGETYAYSDAIVLQAMEVIGRMDPLAFINQHLMRAMGTLGDRFAQGDVSLPHLLKSADVMKHVMGFLEKYMRRKSGADIHDEIQYKGVIVLGTVHQDVHSIGKDLAKTLFENYGYRAIDLGVMTPLQAYLDAAKEHNADAIGLSALLVQTSNHMITVSKMMEEQGLAHLPLLVGGAPVSYRHAAHVAMASREEPSSMRSNVFYCPTAMDGVNVMNALLGSGQQLPILEENRKKLQKHLAKDGARAKKTQELLDTLPRRVVNFDTYQPLGGPWPEPVAWECPLEEFASSIDLKTLFGLNWKFGGTAAREARGETRRKLDALFNEWIANAGREGWVQPRGIYGVFPCNAQGDTVIVYDPRDPSREIGRMTFAVVVGAGKEDTISGAQYFLPRDSGKFDTLGFQIATAGPQITGVIESFRGRGDSESTLYLQGLGDRVAEDVAQVLHARLREMMGVESGRGIRWSPGYPAIPDAANNHVILNAFGPSEWLGVTTTEAGELFPTSSTAAIVCFHPDARYT